MIFSLIIAGLYQGAEANKVDLHYKKFLMKLMNQIIDTRELGVDRAFFETKDGEIEILKQLPDGKYLSQINGKLYLNLDELEDIN